MMNMSDIIHSAQKQGCSDIHLTVGSGVTCRQYGQLKKLNTQLSDEELEKVILDICTDEQRDYFAQGNDLDFAYQTEGELRRLYLGKFYIESDRRESLSDRLKLNKFYSLTVKI